MEIASPPSVASREKPGAVVGADFVEPRWQLAVWSGILGWILDAYYFFVLIFFVGVLAKNFHVSKSAIVWSITITLATRPVGALFFGSLADRFGRRRPLIACVLFFSVVSALTPFARSYTDFLTLRALYGIGMGGYWGIGASLVMESSPARKRGLFSGMLQAGWPLGYLLAAVSIPLVVPRYGWHGLFFGGLFIALLVAVLAAFAPESPSWKESRPASLGQIGSVLLHHKKNFAYLVLLMTAITCLAHGSQDLYPDFLKSGHHFSRVVVSSLAIFYSIGAICGSLVMGYLSERLGRRNSIMLALGIALLAIPAWAFGSSLLVLAAGSFVMQFGVQGVFGVIPAHLNELSPAGVRSLLSGVVYQFGVLFGAPAVSIEFALRHSLGYGWTLTTIEVCSIIALFLICGLGPENRGRNLAS